jgi:CDP-diacylglycerol--glycerol-3-phosphate 3-phosphatidyltransferase
MIDGSFRRNFERVVAPVGRALGAAGVSPDVVTAVGPVMAAACAVAIGTERYLLAALLLLLTGLPDAIDGAVAKATGKSGPRGAFLDSVTDRLSDGLVFGGCAWNLAGTDNPQMSLLPFGIYLAASLVSYSRAKAESLGYDAKGGLMERAERMITLGVGLVFSAIFVPVLWLLFVLTSWTAGARFVKVWRQASGRPVEPGMTAIRQARRRNARRMVEFRNRSKARSDARRARNR